MNCENCDLLKQKEAELAELRKTQNLLFLLLKSGSFAVGQWAGEEAFLGSENQQRTIRVTGKNNASPLDREKLAKQIRTLLKDQMLTRGLEPQHDPREHKLNPSEEYPKK